MSRLIKAGVGLDGRPIYARRVRRRHPRTFGTLQRNSNVSAQDILLVEANSETELRLFDKLPQEVRAFIRENLTVDLSIADIYGQWVLAMSKGDGAREFVRYLERLNTLYLNQTRHVWDVPPPEFNRLPRPL